MSILSHPRERATAAGNARPYISMTVSAIIPD
jgi:hypothetical protein